MAALASVFGKTVRRETEELLAVEHSFVLPKQLMGIEIETENLEPGIVLPSREQTGREWDIKPDGSLMRGQEYVLQRPLAGDELSRAISAFFRYARLRTATTSSTHIHMDMLEESTSPVTLQLIFALVYMLEPVLWSVGDPSRQWCGFTHPVSWMNQETIATLFSENFNIKTAELSNKVRGTSRYFGLNMAALSKYGSLEFRYFPTATSAEQLVGWTNLVQSFKKAAHSIGSMRALNSIMEDEESYQTMVGTYFGNWHELIRTVVPYSQARKSFLSLTESFRGEEWPRRDYGRVVASRAGLQKMIKRKRTPPRQADGDLDPPPLAWIDEASAANVRLSAGQRAFVRAAEAIRTGPTYPNTPVPIPNGINIPDYLHAGGRGRGYASVGDNRIIFALEGVPDNLPPVPRWDSVIVLGRGTGTVVVKAKTSGGMEVDINLSADNSGLSSGAFRISLNVKNAIDHYLPYLHSENTLPQSSRSVLRANVLASLARLTIAH